MAKTTLIAAAVALAPTFAEAQQPPVGHLPFYTCGPTQDVYDGLVQLHNEQPLFEWRTSPIHLNKFWVDAVDGSISITRENEQQGVTCITQHGRDGVPASPHVISLGEPT